MSKCAVSAAQLAALSTSRLTPIGVVYWMLIMITGFSSRTDRSVIRAVSVYLVNGVQLHVRARLLEIMKLIMNSTQMHSFGKSAPWT